MKSSKVRHMVMGIIIGVLIANAIPVIAATGSRTIEVFFRDIKMVVDGKTIVPTDGTGNVVEPFIYNGTTYLPVRAVAQAIGKDVTWDGPNSTVVIGTSGVTSSRPDKLLVDMESISEGSVNTSGWWGYQPKNTFSDFFGNTYGKTWVIKVGLENPDDMYKEYVLNSQYKKFSGTLVVSNETDKSISYAHYFAVYCDDVEVFRKELQQNSDPIPFSVNVAGCNRIKITAFSEEYGYTDFYLGLVDAGFYK